VMLITNVRPLSPAPQGDREADTCIRLDCVAIRYVKSGGVA